MRGEGSRPISTIDRTCSLSTDQPINTHLSAHRLSVTHPEVHLDLTSIPQKTLKGAVTVVFSCRQPATGGGEPPLRKAVLDAVAFSEVEVS